jgi:3-hydroxy-9,10-secoandrosta-1,3,5(10)-triene-9,17-dione monooxygenase
MATDDNLIEFCDAFAGRLAERAADAERERCLSPETLQEAERLWPLVVPTSVGGDGADLDTLLQATRRLAHGCPASAWTISFLVMHSWLVAKFPPEGRAELLTPERPYALTPAPLSPSGTFTPVDGGYRVSGRWEWATGVEHAEWVMVHGIVEGSDLEMRFAVLPRDEVSVDDVWFTSGMAATGSNTVVVDDITVPSNRTVSSTALLLGQIPVEGDGLANLPTISVLALMASAPAIGAAERAVDLYRAQLGERVLAYSMGDRARDQPAAQIRLATAMSDLAAVRARWDQAISELEAEGADGQVGEPTRARMRLVAAATVRDSRRIINDICEGAGARVYFSTEPLQRLQRDVEVLKGHVIFDWDRAAELAGRVALGEPLRPTDMA